MEDLPKTTAKADFDQLLRHFHNVIDQAIAEFKSSNKDQLYHFESKVGELVNSASSIGEYSYLQVQDHHSPNNLNHSLISYEWGEYAKAFSLLWRDVFFQHQLAWLKLRNQKISAPDFQRLNQQSVQVLEDAAKELKQFLEEGPKRLSQPDKQLEKWKLQENPWPIYKTQLQQIPEQCSKLQKQSSLLLNATQVYQSIGEHFNRAFETNLQNLSTLRTTLKSLLQSFTEEESFSANQVVNGMDSLYQKLKGTSDLTDFEETMNNYLNQLPKEQQYGVDTANGLLLYKELDLQKQTGTWLDSEAMSAIYELNTIQEQIQNKIGLSMVNIRNRMKLAKENGLTIEKEKIEQPLSNFIKSLEKSSQKITALQEQLEGNFKNEFSIPKLYDDEFLLISMQNTINQYRQQQQKSWDNIQEWLKAKGSVFRQFQKNVRQEEALSLSEKIVRTVRQRTPEVDNSLYTNMFLTDGWIGNSFVVGRSEELNQMASLIENWKLGFRGDVLITGKRFSGKTLFGKLVSHHFFDSKVIELVPGKKVQIAGRHLMVEQDLGAALDFVVKNTLNTPSMVWIDDLEYWANDKITLSQNVKKLLHTIDQYTDRLFFVVSMSNWLKAHLNRVFEIDKVFQSEINLDNMSAADIEQAIFIRHSATHMELVNKDLEEIGPNQFKKICKRIHHYSDGIIGEALHQWTFAIRKRNNEQLLERQTPNYPLPSFISVDLGILLQSIMMSRKTNEFQLRKLFGPAFNEAYQMRLQRIINLGVLKRSGSWLEINPFLVNDIGKQLQDKLNFHFQRRLRIEKTKKL